MRVTGLYSTVKNGDRHLLAHRWRTHTGPKNVRSLSCPNPSAMTDNNNDSVLSNRQQQPPVAVAARH